MASIEKNILNTLSQAYDREKWKETLMEVFKNVQLFEEAQTVDKVHKDIREFKQLGNVQLENGEMIALYELVVEDSINLRYNRVSLNKIVSSTIDEIDINGVIAIFQKGTADYRMTFSASQTTYDEETEDFIESSTDAKRFTYFLGENAACKTPALQLAEMSTKESLSLEDIEKAFNVEVVSKQFFDDYVAQFNFLVNELISAPTIFPSVFNKKEIEVRNYVKRLMGRLVFLKFIEKKGWLGVPAENTNWEGGDYKFIEHFFKMAKENNEAEIFVSNYLNPLFYQALNQSGRTNNVFELTGTKVPFLSGGLFEPDSEAQQRVNFKESTLDNLFDFYSRYNFTIDEYDTSDKEVGIDPEMLGHIFENLLEDNKDKGAFYTPKEIVHYMCQESLKEYLKTTFENNNVWPEEEEKQKELEQTISNFVEKKETASIIDYDRLVATALKEVKICDPAIGSGAFPMGLLSEIYLLIKNLHDASPDIVGEVWGMMGEDWEPNTVKKNIIQNSIYGVDIEAGAVDIARLRFWLSLIIEEDEPQALPHLDYKIVVGDSLVSKLDDTIIDIDWEIVDGAQTDMFGNPHAERNRELLKKISELQAKFFQPDSDQKTLSLELRNLKIDLLIEQLNLMVKTKGLESKPTGSGRGIAKQMELWLETQEWINQIGRLKRLKQDQDATLNFFDYKLDFPEVMNPEVNQNPGFDIVIGNPPYLRIQGLRKVDDKYATELSKRFESATGSFDLYVLFTEKSLMLTKGDGILNFIMPVKWVNAAFGIGLRKLMQREKAANKIISFEAHQVFNASTYTGLQWFKRDSKELKYYQLSQDLPDTNKLGTFLYSLNEKSFNTYEQNILNEEGWTLTDKITAEILDKINLQPKSVKDIFEKIFQGIATSKDSVYFIMDAEDDGKYIKGYSKELNEIVTIERGLVKPLLKGDQVHRYKKLSTRNYVIFPYKIKESKADLYTEVELRELFPLGYQYIKRNERVLRNRERGRLMNDSLWYRYIYPKSLTLFDSPKLICPDICLGGNYAYDKKGEFYDTTTLYGYIKYEDIEQSFEYFLGILNSNLVWYFLKNTGTVLANGYFRFMPRYVKEIPIYIPNSTQEKYIVEKVNKILIDKESGSSTIQLEQNIDNLVYKLYNLTYEEALIVEPELAERLSREEYEAIEV